MNIDARLKRIVAAQPYPLLFATISGAHLYGFPSPDSDFDLRGAHVLPLEVVVGLELRDETVQSETFVGPDGTAITSPCSPNTSSPHPSPPFHGGEGDGSGGQMLEMDIVSHDVKKFFGLLLKKNGYVLEQLFSPLIVHTTPEHEELMAICRSRGRQSAHLSSGNDQRRLMSAATGMTDGDTSPRPLPGRGGEGGDGRRLTSAATGVITKHHSHHYFGFAETQWNLFLKESPRRVKPLLYVYRVLLTGIHLMRTGEVEANVVTLNEEFKLSYINDLVARKLAGPENLAIGQHAAGLSESEIAFHEGEYQRLRGVLQSAHEASQLPELPSEATQAALNELLVRVRLKARKAS
jgi:predicted nucleotidyltransferase